MLPRPLFESVSHDLCLLLPGAFQNPTFLFHSMTANIICSIVFGTRFSYKDPKFLRLLDLFYQNFTLLSSFSSQVRELVWEAGVGGGCPGHRERGDLLWRPRNAALGRKGGTDSREGQGH